MATFEAHAGEAPHHDQCSEEAKEKAVVAALMMKIAGSCDVDDLDYTFDLRWRVGFSREAAIEQCYRDNAAAVLGVAGSECGDSCYLDVREASDGDFMSHDWPNQVLVDRLRKALADPRVSAEIREEAGLCLHQLVAWEDNKACMSRETRLLIIEAFRRLSSDPMASEDTRTAAWEQMLNQQNMLRRFSDAPFAAHLPE